MEQKKENYEKKIKNENNNYQKTLGKNLRLARNLAKMTQAKLAEEIEASVEHISNIERGQGYSSVKMAIEICNTLNISANFLFEGTITNNENTINSVIDKDLAEDYAKLNPENKKTIDKLIHALVNYQKNNSTLRKNLKVLDTDKN